MPPRYKSNIIENGVKRHKPKRLKLHVLNMQNAFENYVWHLGTLYTQ